MRPQARFQAPCWNSGTRIGFILQFPNSKKSLGSMMNATLQYHRDQAISNFGMSVKAVIDIPNIKTNLSSTLET